MTRTPMTRTLMLPLLGLALAATAAPAQDLGAQAAQVLQRRAPSIVTVKIVLKTEINVMGQTQEREERIQVQGVVVDAGGLIMFSNSAISAAQLQEALSDMMDDEGQPGGFEIKTTPSDIKVVFGEEDTEHPAFLAASDARLDLAFVQLQELGELKLVAVDFPEAGAPKVGQTIVVVSRLNEGYDYAPYFETGLIAGEIKTPQPAFVVAGQAAAVGLPVFAPSGEVLGVLTVVASGMRPQGGGLMQAMGGESPMAQAFRPFVLPSGQVRAVVAQAKERAAEAAKQGR
ncbi:MAG: trypsin-like peptidase domain-containing protein [Planctomycetota bacterium]|nr:trypsin-like peptidase domain-containing protein [Planctomycetota bacterium]